MTKDEANRIGAQVDRMNKVFVKQLETTRYLLLLMQADGEIAGLECREKLLDALQDAVYRCNSVTGKAKQKLLDKIDFGEDWPPGH